MTTAAKLLEKAWQLIEDPEHWCQGNYAEMEDGTPIVSWSENAVRFCAMGALMHVEHDSQLWDAAHNFLHDASHALAPSMDITDINDTKTHDVVRLVYANAIKMAKGTLALEI